MSKLRPSPVLKFIRNALGTDRNGPPDADLLARYVQSKDDGAFELLVWRHAGMVTGVCRATLKDHHAAEDAAQAVFLALARSADSIVKTRSVVGWLHAVARRVSKRAARRYVLRTAQPVSDLGSVAAGNPAEGVEIDSSSILHEEVARLPERYRLPILLCYFEELSYTEAAKRLGWPIGSLNGRIARARDILHKRLLRRGVTLPAAGLIALCKADAAQAISNRFVEVTVRGAASFAARQSVIPGVSSLVVEMAKDALHSGTRMKVTLTLVAILGMFIAGGAIQGSYANTAVHAQKSTPTEESLRDTGTNRITQTVEVLAPRPQTIEEKTSTWIDPKIVAVCEEMNLEFGTFRENRMTGLRGFSLLSQNDVPDPQELQGFRFKNYRLSEEGNVHEKLWTSLAAIDVPFGLEFPNMRPKQLSAVDIEKLASLKNLRYLSISALMFTPSDMEKVSLDQLTDLKLFGAASDKTIDFIIAMPRLERLSLSGTRLSADQVARLAELKRLQVVSGLNLGDEAVFKTVCKFANLRQLSLTHPLPCSSLQHLETLASLRTLSLQGMTLEPESLAPIAKLPHLETLTFSNMNGLTASMASMTGAQRIKTLKVNQCNLNDEALKAIVKLPALSTFELTDEKITDSAFEILSEARELATLHITSPNLTGKGIGKLKKLPKFSLLNANTCDFQPDAVKEIGELKGLVSLQLRSTLATDEQWNCLTNLPSLSEYSIIAPELTDEGLEQIAKMSQLTRLHVLSQHCTDSGLRNLARLRNLHDCTVQSPSISSNAMRALRRMLPHCRTKLLGH